MIEEDLVTELEKITKERMLKEEGDFIFKKAMSLNSIVIDKGRS